MVVKKKPRCTAAADCAEPVYARGVCKPHYQRARKTGDLDKFPRRYRVLERVQCPEDHPHNVETCWREHGCRCDECQGLRKAELRRRRDGHDATSVNSTGTVRRLRALVAIGHSQAKLEAHLGIHRGNIVPIINGKRPRVTAATHEAVRAMFVALWAHPVQGRAGDRSRAIAKKRKWVGPLAWDDIDDPNEVPNLLGLKVVPATEDDPDPADENTDDEDSDLPEDELIDEIAVEQAMRGQKVKLTTLERRVAVRRLHARRWSDSRIGEALHIDERTSLRIRQELGLEAFDFSEIVQVDSA